jgi:hypothetical protein
VESFVGDTVNGDKVVNSVVELVPVDVVDLLPVFEFAVVLFPDDDVFHSESPLLGVPDAPIPFGVD